MFGLLLLCVLIASWVSLASAACDAAGLHVLESSDACSLYCGLYEPCVILDGASASCDGSGSGSTSGCVEAVDDVDGNGTCVFACAFYEYSSYLSVSVRFGSYQSDEEQAARKTNNASYSEHLGSDYFEFGDFFVSDDELDAIGTITVHPDVNRL